MTTLTEAQRVDLYCSDNRNLAAAVATMHPAFLSRLLAIMPHAPGTPFGWVMWNDGDLAIELSYWETDNPLEFLFRLYGDDRFEEVRNDWDRVTELFTEYRTNLI